MVIFGPMLVPLEMRTQYDQRFQPISLEHPLGTDYQGRDTFQLLVHGSRQTLGIAFLTGVFTTVIALVVGMTAGLMGGRIGPGPDAHHQHRAHRALPARAVDAGRRLFAARPGESGAGAGAYGRGAGWRAPSAPTILSLKEREFIEAARVLGLSNRYILFSELMPNIMPFVVINFLTVMRNAITASVALMFLGLVPLDPTNWGMMLNDATGRSGAVQASVFNRNAIIYVMSPMAAVVLFQLGAVFLAHGLDEVLDPRLRAK
ncbi:MAG: ABC transporter permease [Anaerolineae bacterium]|nr:ABC transporter permease [Anaerolineae bacterium]